MNASLETYDKLRHGGFSDEQARALSEAIGEAGQQRRLGAIEMEIAELKRRVGDVETKLETGFNFIRWMLAFQGAAILAILVKVYL